ncbi:MAG: hypothetical protein SVX43_09410 [Cyanobacteriota bacterium]|nr:hypothetical protein [Cyanobacteriota bacterium]
MTKMTSRSKNTTKSISFGSDDRDRALLETLDTLLGQKEFKSFSDLCKAALQQYCFPEARSESLSSSIEEKIEDLQHQMAQFETTSITDALERIESQLSQRVERKLPMSAATALPNPERDPAGLAQLLEPLTGQMAELKERVRQLEEDPAPPLAHSEPILLPKELESIEAQLVQLRERCQRLETQLEQQFSSQQMKCDEEKLPPPPVVETDPILSRLTPLLDEF